MEIPEKQSAQQQENSDHVYKVSKACLMGKISPSKDSLLVEISPQFANRRQMFMHHEAYLAFQEMHRAAKKENIQLTIISAFRSFDHQKRIWENKWNGIQSLTGNINAAQISDHRERAKEILKFSAMPSTSRHHWGTDIDLNSLNNDYFRAGKGKEEYDWLKKNAHKYGFCQPYTSKDKTRQTGYEEEKWHWSYMPVSTIYMENFMHKINYSDIVNFDGWETAEQLNVIKNYVQGINEACMQWKTDMQQ
ncbi:MAG: M15 family metallopeptidase [Bacteroidota bacterium]